MESESYTGNKILVQQAILLLQQQQHSILSSTTSAPANPALYPQLCAFKKISQNPC